MAVALYGFFFTNHGEYGISAHLWLILTGLPLSLVSGLMPHGSILGATAAGILGFVQWAIIGQLILFFQAKNCAKKP